MANELTKLIKEAIERFNKLTPSQQAEHFKKQREATVAAEMSWPEPKFHYKNGVKIYHSYEDYLNG